MNTIFCVYAMQIAYYLCWA